MLFTRVADERRQEPRVTSVKPINVQRHDRWGFPIGLRLGRTLDLSHNGLRLELDEDVHRGEEVELSVALGNELLLVRGRVRFIERRQDGKVELGIQFKDLDATAYDQLHQQLICHSVCCPY